MLKYEDVHVGDLLVYESKEELFWVVVLAIRPEERAMDIDVIVAGETAEIYESDFKRGLIFRP